MKRLVTISYTELDAGGGVPKFNRDLHSAFPDRECVHYSWWNHPFYPEIDERGTMPEWYKAQHLNLYLTSRGLLRPDDLIVADGFWADGLDSFRFAISHSHGIWSHLTKEDVEAGKTPDMPYHHAAQMSFRDRWVSMGKRLTAVSSFIAGQLMQQWGWSATVINNGVDTDHYRPMPELRERAEYYSGICKRPYIIHGVNDRTNVNKGWDHIEELQRQFPDLMIQSLDEACFSWGLRSDRAWEKNEILAQADLVVHPSGYEGNSMFVAEALSSGVPVIGYNVGFLEGVSNEYATVIDRSRRSPEFTASAVRDVLASPHIQELSRKQGRSLALEHLSLHTFRRSWRDFVEELDA